MLGGLALKRRWQHAARARARTPPRPNLVMGANVQVCWKKFANYFEVEPRYVPMEPGRCTSRPTRSRAYCDDNTIGVVTDPRLDLRRLLRTRLGLCLALDGIQAATGHDIPVHVDGASGAMVAPFLDPGLMWDFQLERVASINTSGHKYGHVFPGLGWALWRDADAAPRRTGLPGRLPGRQLPSFTLNFSRPGAHVVAQYYSFLRVRLRGAARPGRPQPYDSARTRRPDPHHRPLRAGHGRLRTPRLRLPFGARHPGLHGVRRLPGDARPAAGTCPRTPSPRPARTSPSCVWSYAPGSPPNSPACSSPT